VSEVSPPLNAASVAGRLAEQLELRGEEYAVGGAIALGYWGAPRGTIDVDLTLYLPPDHLYDCIRLLHNIGCECSAAEAVDSLRGHGFCRATFAAVRVDVFLPTTAFYEAARARRKRVQLANRPMMIWDAESLAVFKVMFFRRKDLADVEQVLRTQGGQFDRVWVRERLAEMYGPRDPRLAAWDDLARDIPAA